MELKVIEKTKTRLVFEIQGEDHTLCNALREELNTDKAVKAAGYTVQHPLIAHPKMVIETTTATTPQKAISEAIKRMKKASDGLIKDIKKF